ncbi:LLM class F420-dependent oxidoreductase [Mycobacterium sp.]|uniref:LLM class F420-dependent oxidoreductase n=1 Tax=Mycobacterium sp. TaxID=1785 RepID=UPI0031CE4B53
MRFAVTYPMCRRTCDPELVSGRGVAMIARAAEAAGFDGVGFTDHPAPTQRWLDAGGHDALDPFVALGFAAAATTTLRLVPNVVVLPYRNPFLVAKSAATLDVLSGGRFTLAVGVGYLEAEFAALGVDYDERSDLCDEALEVIRAVWTSAEVSFTGRHFDARGITARPRPVSAPPIWIGGNTGAARRRVAQHGDGWCPFPASPGLARTAGTAAIDSPARLAAGIADLRRRFDDANRDWSKLDVVFTNVFTNVEGGSPASEEFNADAYLAGLEQLTALGVTWVQIGLPDDSLAHVLDTIGRFQARVIDAS